MVDGYLDGFLRAALAAAAFGSLVILALMVLDLFVPARWNWYNAIAFFAATTCLAGARLLHKLVPQPAAKQS